MALVMFYVATVDVVSLIPHRGHYHDISFASEARGALRGTIVVHVVDVVDDYLLPLARAMKKAQLG